MPYKVSQMRLQKYEISQIGNQEAWELRNILVKCMGRLAHLIKSAWDR